MQGIATVHIRFLPTSFRYVSRRVLSCTLQCTVFDLMRKKSWYNRDRCSYSWIKFDSSRWKTRRSGNWSHLTVESLTISYSIVLKIYNYHDCITTLCLSFFSHLFPFLINRILIMGLVEWTIHNCFYKFFKYIFQYTRLFSY